MTMRTSIPILCALFLATTPITQADQTPVTFDKSIQPFLTQHCIECHEGDKPKADLRLDTLTAEFGKHSVAEKWTEVLDQLSSGSMPPKKQPKPHAAEVTKVVTWITGQLQAAAKANQGDGRVVLRRLNRAEYNNTIRDLVGVDFQPADDFPVDTAAHGFDNVGSALIISPLHMEKYLDAARQIVDRAIVSGPRPRTAKWRVEVEKGHRSNQFEGRRSAGRDELWVNDPVSARHRYIVKGGGSFVRDGWVIQKGAKDEAAAGFRWFKIPQTGEYIVRVRAAAVVPTREQAIASAQQIILEEYRAGQWKKLAVAERREAEAKWLREEWPEIVEHFNNDPMYDFGFPRLKVVDETRKVIGEINVESSLDEPGTYEFRHRFKYTTRGLQSINIRNSYSVPGVLQNRWFQRDARFARPELHIDWVEFEGPVVDDWPTASHERILFDSPDRDNEAVYARQVIERFMTGAFRRPVTRAEIDRMVALFNQVRPKHDRFTEAIKAPLIATLASPHFVYLVEKPAPQATDGKAATTPRLTDYELASRLSYFLWSTMPDDQLFDLAKAGRLQDDKVLAAQVRRMLKDDRAAQFVSNFAGQWLGLRAVGTVVPDESLYPRYDDHLQTSIVRESEAFFKHILDNDLSVLNFIDSDFAVVNGRLARFYGIAGVKGDRYRAVPLKPQHKRGGLLTQASMLTLTSNGTRTSPVIRGVWLLENIPGTPPPPPPPDAGDIQPKVPGIDKATVRVRLEHHRKIPQCASCHAKIDPLGFALENYNAIGRWRDKEGFGYKGRVGRNDPDVDASGELPDGRAFRGIDDFKAIMKSSPYTDLFCKCLTEKLLTYALGRGLGFADRPTVQTLIAQLKKNDYRLADLIVGIVQSESFRSK